MPSKRASHEIDDLDTDGEPVEEWGDRFARDRAASGESIPIIDEHRLENHCSDN
jgi:hypothetical protein